MSTNARASTPAATAASADEPAAASAATAVATSRPKAAEAAAHGPTAAQPEASTPSSMTAQPTSASSAGNSKRMRAGTHAKGRRRAVIEDHSTEDEADDQGAGRGARSRKRAAASDDDDDQDETSSSSSSSNDEDSDAETGDDDDETACAICGKDYSPAKNCIVLCDGKDCDIPVHQKCYGIDVVPPGDEKWFCQRCEDNVPVDKTVPKQYIHAVCALANPSIDVEKNSITVEKWLLDKEKCYICSESKGLTVACSIAACKRWFHVTCGVKEGILDPPSRNVAKSQILCAEHKQKPSRGQTHKRGGAQAGGRTSAAQFNASNSGGNSTSTSSGNSSSSAAKRRRRGNTDKDGNWEAHTSSSDDEDEKGSIDIEMPDADGDETMTPTKAEQASSSSRAGGPGAAAGASGSGASAAGNSTKLKARRSGAGGPLAGSTGNASGTSGAAGQSRPGLGDRRPDDAQDAASGSAQPRVPVRSSGPSPAPGTETRRVEPLGMAKKTSDPVAGNKFGSRPLAANQAIKMTSGDKPWLKESSVSRVTSRHRIGWLG
nr:Protein AF-17 [Polyrhizophydium stewartii]